MENSSTLILHRLMDFLFVYIQEVFYFLAQSSLAPLLCQSGYADSNGICGQGLKSIQKGRKEFLFMIAGKVCRTDSDCPTNDMNNLAKCKCGFNSNGTKYCDIMPGDTEWVQTRAAVHKI